VPKPKEKSLEAIRLGFTEATDQSAERPKREAKLAVTQEFLDWRPEEHFSTAWPSELEEVR
jgi:hypothetical protein